MILKTVEFLRANGLAALCQHFSVKSARHGKYPNLVLLKYDQINSPMGEPLVQECRGLILDEADDWAVVSFPFRKFFNHGEGHAAPIDWSTARVYEKLDGSLMTLFPYRGVWQVASSGMPDAAGEVYGHEGTFADLFWETWTSMKCSLPHRDAQACFMFEMMTPYNRVVVPHTSCRLVCIGGRNLATLEEFSPESVAEEFGWEAVRSHSLTTLDEVLGSCSAINPLEAEGYVVRDAAFNRVKVKSPQYVALAHLKESASPRRMLEIVRANESSEFLAYFPELKAEYDRVRIRFDALCEELTSDYARISKIPDQKSFAMEAQRSRCSSSLFAIRAGKCKTVREFFAACTKQLIERAMGVEEPVMSKMRQIDGPP